MDATECTTSPILLVICKLKTGSVALKRFCKELV